MKDYFTIGSIAGLIGGTVGLIFSHIMFLLGLTPMSSLHLAASLVVIDIINLSTGGIIWSIFTHLMVAAFFSVLLTYIIIKTGKDFWILKGVGFGFLFCLIAHSYLIPLMRTDIRPLIFNPPSFGIIGITHMMIGLISSFIIVKYGVGS